MNGPNTPEGHRLRAMDMHLKMRAGMPAISVARLHRVSLATVYRAVRNLPEDVRERIDQFGLSDAEKCPNLTK